MTMNRLLISFVALFALPVCGCMHYNFVATSPNSNAVYVTYSKFLGPSGILTCFPRSGKLRCVDSGPIIDDDSAGAAVDDEYKVKRPSNAQQSFAQSPTPNAAASASSAISPAATEYSASRYPPANCGSDEILSISLLEMYDEPSVSFAQRILRCWIGVTVTVTSPSGRSMRGTVISLSDDKPYTMTLRTVAGSALVELSNFARIEKEPAD